MAKSPIATIAILTFLASWNDFFIPLIFLSSTRLYTVPLGLQMFSTEAGTDWQLVMAAATVSTVPLIIVFFCMQRRIVESLAMSGIK
jgi:multiple sugar transport system permease protein